MGFMIQDKTVKEEVAGVMCSADGTIATDVVRKIA